MDERRAYRKVAVFAVALTTATAVTLYIASLNVPSATTRQPLGVALGQAPTAVCPVPYFVSTLVTAPSFSQTDTSP